MQQTRQGLEEKGWKVGTVSDFLELSRKEALVIEIKLALSRIFRGQR